MGRGSEKAVRGVRDGGEGVSVQGSPRLRSSCSRLAAAASLVLCVAVMRAAPLARMGRRFLAAALILSRFFFRLLRSL